MTADHHDRELQMGTLFQALTDKLHVDSMCLYTVCKQSIGIIEYCVKNLANLIFQITR